MRIVSWNCAMALHKKWEYAASFAPDVLVVPEAARFERQPEPFRQAFPHHEWVGTIDTKGLLVASRRPFDVPSDVGTSAHHVMACEVGGERPLKLVAVWTQRDAAGTYTQHLSRAIETLEDWLTGDCLLVGDFNANAIWDREHRRDITHSANVQRLEGLGFSSVYHAQSGEDQGAESAFTHAFRRHANNLFHIDYCFASASLMERGCAIRIPEPEDWIGLSDHAPLVVDIS